MTCVDNAIRIIRKILMRITGISNDYIINGESIRGAELVKVKNGKKIPIGYDETCIVTYLNPTDQMSIVDASNSPKTAQSYEFHAIIYGNDSKEVAQKIKNNLYIQPILETLRENGIGILSIDSPTNTSEFITSDTYMLRSDLRFSFNCILEDDSIETENDIESINITYKETTLQ